MHGTWNSTLLYLQYFPVYHLTQKARALFLKEKSTLCIYLQAEGD